MIVTREQIQKALAAPMPDGCTVRDYLEDAIPNNASLAELGIDLTNDWLSNIREEIHDDFYTVLITAILTSAHAAPLPTLTPETKP